ncbi:MAG: hypothetical protein WD557_06370 [Dehalococcoidia bacterium]
MMTDAIALLAISQLVCLGELRREQVMESVGQSGCSFEDARLRSEQKDIDLQDLRA